MWINNMKESKEKKVLPLVLDEQTFSVIEQITAGMPGGFFIYHADGLEELIYANQALIEMYGCDSLEEFKEHTGYTFPGLVHPDDLQHTEDTIRRQIQEHDNNLDYVEYRIIRKDGSVRQIKDYGHFVHTEIYGDVFYVFLEDATEQYLERRQAAENELLVREKIKALIKLEHTTASLNTIHEMLGSGMWSMEFDKQGNMESVFWSNEFRRMLGYQNQLDFPNVLESWSDLLHEDDKARVLNEFYGTLADYRGRKIYDVEYRLLTKNRGYRWYHAIGKPTRKDDGTPITYIGMFVDITEKKLLDQNLEKQRKLLEEALEQARYSNRAKTIFLNNMSHDIRTPMNAIIGFATLAATHVDDHELVKNYLAKIMTSSRHLLSLINDALDMSRIESGKLQLEEAECHLPDIIHDLQTIIQTEVLSKQMTVSFDTQEITNPVFLCDKLKLNQILLNVIGNALKFTPPHGNVCIRVSEKPDSESGFTFYEFRVRDNGIGMNPDFLKHIFEPFERERTSTISGVQGTGLGMTIAKKLVEMMNGSIAIESKAGKGSEFTISLPFRLPEKPGDTPDGPCISVPVPAPVPPAAPPVPFPAPDAEDFQGRHILLAEDNELNQEIAMTILEDAGFEVDVADNGSIAVEKIKTSAPGTYDIVLMDIQMPVMNGYEAARTIRALPDPNLAAIPILAVTANAFEEDKKCAIKAGMNGHLGKPIEIDKLMAALKEILL